MKRVAGWAALVGAAMVLAGCSSTSAPGGGKDDGKGGGKAPGTASGRTAVGAGTTSPGKADAASALAAAPGALAAAKTLTLDATGTVGTQKVSGTAQFAVSGAPRGSVDLAVTGAPPKDLATALPSEVGVIVADGREYDLAATLLGGKEPEVAASLTTRLNGRRWVSVLPGADVDLRALRPDLVFGTLQEASDNPATALAALLASGVLTPDPAPGPGGTFHYTGTLDRESMKTAKYSEQQGRGILDDIRMNAVSEKVEIWLGPDGLPAEVKIDESADTGLGGVPQTADVHLTWDKPLTAAAPAASDVAEQGELTQ